jgi:DNA-binding CsgD family transcriptional regulator
MGPATRDITGYLLDLHTRANELGYRELQRFAMERLQEMLPFDSGLFAVGTIRDGVPHGHDAMLHNKRPEFMESWDQVKHEDRVAIDAITHRGTTVNHSVTSEFFAGCERLVEHCRAWEVEHVLCTAHISMDAGLYWVMSVYRNHTREPFTETERAAMELIVPHVFAAARQARLGQLRSATRVSESHGQVSAITNFDGVVLEADPGFVDMLRAGFPGWNGPSLPKELIESFQNREMRVVHGPIVVRADDVGDVRLLHVRRAVIADQLTAREREIALAFSSGDTYRQIGEHLGIAPNTVRRHLANIYGKLGISSKVELDRMVSGL